jgi:hypothetical protein
LLVEGTAAPDDARSGARWVHVEANAEGRRLAVADVAPGRFTLFVDTTDAPIDRHAIQVVAGGGATAHLLGVRSAVPRDGALVRLRITVARVRAARWIGIDGASDGDARWELSTSPGDPQRRISAEVRGGDRGTQWVRVGACSQWRLVRGVAYLRITGPYRLARVRLAG